jgi:hypothetical protein
LSTLRTTFFSCSFELCNRTKQRRLEWFHYLVLLIIYGDQPTEANGMWGSCDSKRNVGIDSLMASILYTWFAYEDLTYSVK